MGHLTSVTPSFDDVRGSIAATRGHFAATEAQNHRFLPDISDPDLAKEIKANPKKSYYFITTSNIDGTLPRLPLGAVPIIVQNTTEERDVYERLDRLEAYATAHGLFNQSNCYCMFTSADTVQKLTSDKINYRRALKAQTDEIKKQSSALRLQ